MRYDGFSQACVMVWVSYVLIYGLNIQVLKTNRYIYLNITIKNIIKTSFSVTSPIPYNSMILNSLVDIMIITVTPLNFRVSGNIT